MNIHKAKPEYKSHFCKHGLTPCRLCKRADLKAALADPTEEEWEAAATDPNAQPFRGIWLQLLANRRERFLNEKQD
jgi:hypothetical protein